MLDEPCASHAFFMTSLTEVSWENNVWDPAGQKAGGEVRLEVFHRVSALSCLEDI